MKVINHRLHDSNGDPIRFVDTPNKSSGVITPRFLVIHYTAGSSLEGAVSWLSNKAAKASAHLVIGRDGEIVQMVAFNRKAWHAGRSSWGDIVGLNSHSIGIELDNAGELTQRADGRWVASFGRPYDDADVVVARHRHDPETAAPSGWHAYSEEQIAALNQVTTVLADKYKFEAILGHDDIAPKRKRDPGPACPMASLRARLEGRAEDTEPDPGDEPRMMGPI